MVVTLTENHYGAELTAGSLKVQESRIIADLLLRRVGSEEWQENLYKNNALQARNVETSRRLGRLIRQRLELMDAELWRLVRDGSKIVATHACLAAAVKHSALLVDFLDLVVREQYRLFASKLSPTLWEDYLNDCRGRDPVMPLWNDSTRRRLRSSVYQALAQAGFLDSTRTLRIQPVHIATTPAVPRIPTAAACELKSGRFDLFYFRSKVKRAMILAPINSTEVAQMPLPLHPTIDEQETLLAQLLLPTYTQGTSVKRQHISGPQHGVTS